MKNCVYSEILGEYEILGIKFYVVEHLYIPGTYFLEAFISDRYYPVADWRENDFSSEEEVDSFLKAKFKQFVVKKIANGTLKVFQNEEGSWVINGSV